MEEHNLKDRLAEEIGNRLANPIIRSMYPSKSRGQMAREFAQAFALGYDSRDGEVKILREANEDYRVRLLSAERQRNDWEWEYKNLCKFANQYEEERDTYKAALEEILTLSRCGVDHGAILLALDDIEEVIGAALADKGGEG